MQITNINFTPRLINNNNIHTKNSYSNYNNSSDTFEKSVETPAPTKPKNISFRGGEQLVKLVSVEELLNSSFISESAKKNSKKLRSLLKIEGFDLLPNNFSSTNTNVVWVPNIYSAECKFRSQTIENSPITCIYTAGEKNDVDLQKPITKIGKYNLGQSKAGIPISYEKVVDLENLDITEKCTVNCLKPEKNIFQRVNHEDIIHEDSIYIRRIPNSSFGYPKHRNNILFIDSDRSIDGDVQNLDTIKEVFPEVGDFLAPRDRLLEQGKIYDIYK